MTRAELVAFIRRHERLKYCYFHVFPDGRTRLAWPGITYFRVRPDWARHSDFRTPSARIVELPAGALHSAA